MRIILLTALLTGCASIWPDACRQDGRKIVCDCSAYRIEDGPGATIRQTCNGQAMPLTIRAKTVRVAP
jgi:hypothetical protein